MRRLFIIGLLLIIASFTSHAQPQYIPINADNIMKLGLVERINFADYDAEFTFGWFASDVSGSNYLVSDSIGRVWHFTDTGEVVSTMQISDDFSLLVDAAFLDSASYVLQVADGQTYLNERLLDVDLPAALWLDTDAAYVEATEALSGDSFIRGYDLNTRDSAASTSIPYAPADDPEAVVRIGRIPLPYVVTSSETGIVKLWHVQTGDTLYDVDNGMDEPSVFGNINNSATHLVWRDNANEALYLLDFETGENHFIDMLDGAYAQWFFLSNDASVIIAVNLDFEPNIFVWNVATGARLDLGAYRECNRPQPDMARLSADGTTLIIGCEAGLDIYRIVPD